MSAASIRLVPRVVAATAALAVVLLFAGCAGAQTQPTRPGDGARVAPATPVEPVVPITEQVFSPPAPTRESTEGGGVLLGIDVLERQDFGVLQGKRIGLLTHPAGVNRFGVSTIDVLRRDKRLRLVALFSVEHGIHGTIPAGEKYEDHIDPETGLMVHSLYNGRTRSATPEQLRDIDVLVIDLQDIGTRSYTFISAMLYQLEACFENNVEVVVLDRPNPLGGLKVSGPITDPEWVNYLAAFRVPYVHGLTIGELARLAASEPGVMRVSEDVRRRGRLTVVPMRGWRRAMTWPETGLAWRPTSPNVPSFEAVVGYPMTGLGAQLGGFRHGLGTPHPFRLLTHPSIPPAKLAAELAKRGLPGLRFVPRTVNDAQGRPVAGLFVDVTDWNAWEPTSLNFHMMQLACTAPGPNPFAAAAPGQADLYNRHVGVTAWWKALTRDGARVGLGGFLGQWEREATAFQERSRRYWLYSDFSRASP